MMKPHPGEKRILLSVPHMSGLEMQYVASAFESNWISTVGPNLTAFEQEMEAVLGAPAVALSSGTAAIHLGLKLLGVGPGDEVICPTFTFAASANPIRYLGAEPVFIDSERRSWNLDPQLLARELEWCDRGGRLPKAVIVVHLFGQCADMDEILPICRSYGVPVLEDAAEALGARYHGRPAGNLADVAAISFNGNKIITTSGGGMLISNRKEWVEKARFWSTQSREPGVAYQHREMGFNYRMSNVLAGIGRAQLHALEERVSQRRAVAARYAKAFESIDGMEWMPQREYGLHTNWLSCFLVDGQRFGVSRDQLIEALDLSGIESRPVWKPMHMQPLFSDCRRVGGAVSEELFEKGICLPSSSSLSHEDQQRVIDCVVRTHENRQPKAHIRVNSMQPEGEASRPWN